MLDNFFESHFSKLDPFFNQAFILSRSYFSNIIYFSIPGLVHFDTKFYSAIERYRFPSISITGRWCGLNCEHCNGKILENMIPATNPEDLLAVCKKIKMKGGKGCLISGGSSKKGEVPLKDFIPTIKQIKNRLGLDVVVHTGIINPELAEALADAKIDAAMIDIIGSNKTIQKVYHPNITVDDFDQSLTLLEENRIPTVPHIVVGIHYGKLKGEKKALEIISKHNPAALVIVALTPLDKTPMEKITPPSPTDISRVILASRFLMPKKKIVLGCIRPGGKHKSETDILAIKAGVNGIAYPSEEGYNYAKNIGLDIRFSEECCSLIYREKMLQNN
jgi:uncharacterized radical SAM superfamily protein